MKNNKPIKVLWVEDDPLVTSAYPNEAYMISGIVLHPFPNWEIAEKELTNDYSSWDAILLDAKCRYKANDADKADKFLSNVFAKIRDIASRKNRTIPWYVLSEQGEDDIRDLIPEVNEWDEEWLKHVNRRFYSKNGKVNIGGQEKHERHVLFQRIKDQVTYYKLEIQIEHDLYPDVFKALDRLDLASEVGSFLMQLLIPIHFKGTSNSDYNRRYIDLRKALENVFRDMVRINLLPAKILGKGEKDSVNLSWSSLFLGGKQPVSLETLSDKDSEKKFWIDIIRYSEHPLLPKQLSKWLKEVIFQTGGAAHTSNVEEEIALNLENYLPHVDGSPYMLRSLIMGFCDFILWYDNFKSQNPSIEKKEIQFWAFRK